MALFAILVRFLVSEKKQAIEITLGKSEWVERAHQSMTKYRNASLELNIPEEEVAEMSRAATVQHLSDSGQEEALQAILEKHHPSHYKPSTQQEPNDCEATGWVPVK
ncbi:hypothetical protein BSKO_03261 [Bryopsis sp. KO-2023]|nr:hypothetical protein BSKO_03261 [Bryopsis sp. KO-2023]